MPLILLIVLVSLCTGEGVDFIKRHWNDFRSGSVSKSSGSRGTRFAAAAKTDAGYWARSAATGFPQFRHGFAESWHRHRRDHDVLAAKRARSRADSAETRARILPEIDGHKRRLQSARDEIRRQRLQDGPHDTDGTCQWCGAEDGAECATDCPYRNQDWRAMRRIRRDRRDAGDQPGEDSKPALAPPQPAQVNGNEPAKPTTTSPATEGTQMTAATDINYPEVIRRADALKAETEQLASDIAAAQKRFEEVADGVAAVDADSQTQGEAMDLAGALGDAAKRISTLQEQADQFRRNVAHRHGGIHDAVQDSPVSEPANKPFYVEG